MIDDEADDRLRGALRDLIPDYTGPVDPLPRVVATVRRRRVRQRSLLAVGAAGLASVLAAAVLAGPALLAGGGTDLQAASSGESPGPVPSASGGQRPPDPEPTVFEVATGTIKGVTWSIGSTTPGSATRRCLISDDRIFSRDAVCFSEWKGPEPAWTEDAVRGAGLTVTRVAGVTPSGVTTVRVRYTDGGTVLAPARRTPTDPSIRFFGSVVEGTVGVRDVTLLDATGTALGPPATDPGLPECRTRPDALCAEPK